MYPGRYRRFRQKTEKPILRKNITPYESQRLLKLLRQQGLDQIPPKLMPLWLPYRKKFITGGRGSAKTQSVIRIMIRIGMQRRVRVVFAREIFGSIRDSLHAEIKELIILMGYEDQWDMQETQIINRKTGTVFKFKGLRDLRAAQATKGLAQFDFLIVDEAEAVPEVSWNMAIHTIRRNNSEIWCIWNKYFEIDPVMKQYMMCKDHPTTLFIECNYNDNPWFPEVLRTEMEIMKAFDYDLYLHIYMNHPIAQVEKAVMKRTDVEAAMNRVVEPEGRQIIGVDVARYGDDKTVAYERRGYKMKKLFERKKESPIVTAREIAALADDPYVIINVDNGGMGGGGLIDKLKIDLGYKNVRSINFGGTASEDHLYANIATEMYFQVEAMLPFLEIPRSQNAIQDLSARTFGYDTKIRRIIQVKDKFKELYGRSPDDGDAIILCCYVSGASLAVPEDERIKMKQIVQENIKRNKGSLDL